MASSAPADSSHGGIDKSEDGSCSHFRKIICLYDWWLVKTESEFQGKRLGIAGLTSREKKQAMRVFSSAAISKRLDVFNLETSDGVIISIQGFINKQRTANNGFPSEVFKDFVFGFPPNWESYAEKYCTGEDSTTVSGLDNSPSTVQCSLEETPKKNGHVINEDRKEVKVSKDQPHKVSENMAIHFSQISNLGGKHVHEKGDEMNVTPIGYSRCSERLRNLKGNQENPTSSCSLKDEINVSPTSGVITETLDDMKQNTSLGGIIPSGRKLAVLEDQSQNAPEIISIPSSQISNLSSQHADEKRDKKNVTAIGFRRCSERLRNLRGNKENSASCSLKDETNVSSISGVTTVTRDDEKLNGSLGGAIPSWRKLYVSEKSPFHLSAKISRSKMKVRRVTVCGLESQKNTLNPLPVVSDPENSLVQNEIGGGSIPISPGNELQETVDTNVVKILGDGSVKDGPQQPSKSKQRQKSQNVNTKAAKETDAKEESTPKSTRRKIIYYKQVYPPSPDEKAKLSVVSPECSAFGRSRSGRLLLPPMEFWRNQIPVYDLTWT